MSDKKEKLLYLMRYDLVEHFNLKQKFDGQLSGFSNIGFDTYYIAFDRHFFYLVSHKGKKIVGKTHFGIPSYIHTLFYIDFNYIVMKLMKSVQWDWVYWRAAPCWYTSYLAAKAIHNNGAKMIYEYPTFLSTKEKPLNFCRKVFSEYSDYWQRKVNEISDGFVMIGEHVGTNYWGKPAINISNGIDVKSVPVRKPNYDPNAVHLLALASMSYWHGYDRLIRSLAAYKGNQKIIIHMVGDNSGGSLEDWKNLTTELNLNDCVIFHGTMSGKPLEELFNLCDLGINSLGLYRKQLYVTSELKAREYAARGLPFVRAVDDEALDSAECLYWFRVPNDESIPDMQAIVDFALCMRENSECAQNLRNFAMMNMTWEAQYKNVFNLLYG
ncbi:MAG: glycosyltransferase [Bacillus sp. (in: firmicutes)]